MKKHPSRKPYQEPHLTSEKCFETTALTCAKTQDPPPGSWHMTSPYDTWTGHFGSGFHNDESLSGTRGVGIGPGVASSSYHYSGLCLRWITYSS